MCIKSVSCLNFVFLLLLFWLFSCSTKEKDFSKPINTTINYSKIDLYPVLPECDSVSLDLQKSCFYNAVSKRIYTGLKKQNLVFSKSLKDSVSIVFVVDTLGISKVKNIIHFANTSEKDSIDYYLTKSVDELPKMKPAIKMGIPVNSQFVLPVVFNTKTE